MEFLLLITGFLFKRTFKLLKTKQTDLIKLFSVLSRWSGLNVSVTGYKVLRELSLGSRVCRSGIRAVSSQPGRRSQSRSLSYWSIVGMEASHWLIAGGLYIVCYRPLAQKWAFALQSHFLILNLLKPVEDFCFDVLQTLFFGYFLIMRIYV